jgi:hypothetical protein
MTTPGQATFMERMLARFHDLVPDVPVMIIPQEAPPAMLGLSPAQVTHQTRIAMAAALDALHTLWPPATAGLPLPLTAETSWQQESGHTSTVLALAQASHSGPLLDAADRITAADSALVELGWITTRRGPDHTGPARLLARRGPTLAEVTAWTRPDAFTLRIHHGPVLVGAAGTELIATGTRTIALAPRRT